MCFLQTVSINCYLVVEVISVVSCFVVDLAWWLEHLAADQEVTGWIPHCYSLWREVCAKQAYYIVARRADVYNRDLMSNQGQKGILVLLSNWSIIHVCWWVNVILQYSEPHGVM